MKTTKSKSGNDYANITFQCKVPTYDKPYSYQVSYSISPKITVKKLYYLSYIDSSNQRIKFNIPTPGDDVKNQDGIFLTPKFNLSTGSDFIKDTNDSDIKTCNIYAPLDKGFENSNYNPQNYNEYIKHCEASKINLITALFMSEIPNYNPSDPTCEAAVKSLMTEMSIDMKSRKLNQDIVLDLIDNKSILDCFFRTGDFNQDAKRVEFVGIIRHFEKTIHENVKHIKSQLNIPTDTVFKSNFRINASWSKTSKDLSYDNINFYISVKLFCVYQQQNTTSQYNTDVFKVDHDITNNIYQIKKLDTIDPNDRYVDSQARLYVRSIGYLPSRKEYYIDICIHRLVYYARQQINAFGIYDTVNSQYQSVIKSSNPNNLVI